MQYKIQELLPGIGRNFWITKLLNKPLIENMVISDLRFVHEYDMIKKVNSQSIIIKAVKPGPLTDNHSSEREWEYIKEDILVINDGTLQELHVKIDRVIRTLLKS